MTSLKIAERNLREQTRFGPRMFHAYGQDVIAVLEELDRVWTELVQAQAAAMAAIAPPVPGIVVEPAPIVRKAGR